LLNKALQALKLSVAIEQSERPFWQARYYDFNVYTEKKRIEKLRYMHCNPVKRGLVSKPWDWPWSGFRHYLTGRIGTIEIESEWIATRRELAATESHVSNARRGAPIVSLER
jgi:putative transposase